MEEFRFVPDDMDISTDIQVGFYYQVVTNLKLAPARGRCWPWAQVGERGAPEAARTWRALVSPVLMRADGLLLGSLLGHWMSGQASDVGWSPGL